MMTRKQHLLLLTMEECSEVAHRCSKGARFGLDEVQDGQALNNEQRLAAEIADLVAVLRMLEEEIERPMLNPPPEIVRAKQDKVEKYMNLSRERGQLQDISEENKS